LSFLAAALLASTVLPPPALSDLEHGRFTLVNNLPEPIVEIYALSPTMALAPRGDDLLDSALAPDDTLLLAPPCLACNFLLMDSSGNSYLASLPQNLYDDGFVHIDMSCMTFSAFHTGSGSSPLVVTNGMDGIRIDHVLLDCKEDRDLLGRHVLFAGEKLILWLEPGIYSILIVDQSDQEIHLDSIALPESGVSVVVTDEHTRHLGSRWAAGSGSSLIEVKSNLATSPLVQIRVSPASSEGATMEIVPPQPMRAHDRVLVHLQADSYNIEALDADGCLYHAANVYASPDTTRWRVTDADLVFDFGFN